MNKPTRSYAKPLSQLLGKTIADLLARQGFASTGIITHWPDATFTTVWAVRREISAFSTDASALTAAVTKPVTAETSTEISSCTVSAVRMNGVTTTESAKLTMTGLDGEAGLYAEACFLFYCEDDTLTIFDWTGMTYASASIFSASQTVNY